MIILIFIVILLVLIIVHEFGHFIVAKKSGIRVDEFGIGFPPKIAGIKKGETEYTINAIPFGGFVKIFGENPDKESLTGADKDRALINKPRYIQAAVLAAGVFFNILLAWILFSTTFALGTSVVVGTDSGKYNTYISNEKVLITGVLPDSPAENKNLLPGDEIVSLSMGDTTIEQVSPVAISSLVSINSGENLTIQFKRSGELRSVEVIPQTGLIKESPETPAIGIAMGVVGTVKLPIHLAIWEGAQKTVVLLGRITVGITSFILDALLLRADLSSVAGPVGIVGLVGSVSTFGIIALLDFVAFISLNLAIINLIPFPALDGGRLLFLAIEAVKGSPIRPAVANTLNFIGFALLIILMLVVTFSDITRLLG